MKNTDNSLSPLDDAGKYGIITDEELEEIGVSYGSRERYEETIRSLAVRLSGTQIVRGSISDNRRPPTRIDQGTSTVPLGELSETKKINIVGKVINTADDAALLFSSFRDPRIEIFNIAYTSKTGEILAHTAWTNGLPGAVMTIDSPSPGEGLSRILNIKENLNAEKIWIAHNHPSGDPAPSDQDIAATRLYNSHFKGAFSGHIVLDHDKYYFIAPNGMSYENDLRKSARNFFPAPQEQAETINSPAHFASIFKEILSGSEDVTTYAILDNAHKIVSWVYGDPDNTAELKNYMRVCGGSSAAALTNNETAYRKLFADAYNFLDTDKDIFLDVIKVNRSTGSAEKSFAEKAGAGGKWQMHEPKQVKYIINNRSIAAELKLNNPLNDNPSVYEDQENFYIKQTFSNNKQKEALMQIPITSQAEYDMAVKNRQHIGNELIIQNTADFISVRTDVTVGKNGRCKTDDKSTVTITAKENGIVTAEGKTTVIGHDDANIIAKGNCKITLHDSAFGNCYEHCHVTLNGTSKISADGSCTIHAYDESSVSASGSSKVYTYQKATAKGTDVTALSGKGESTLIGQKNCTITAKDNCIVYASDDCTVQAADNCLVVANKYATITAKDNCLVMSNENPNKNISLSDKCEHLKLEDVNDKNIMGALKQMAQSKAVVERPYVAIQILKDNIPQTRREAVNRRLNTMGLKDQTATKNYLYNLIEATPTQKNQTPAQNMERQLETARKAGYVQGVCECVAVVGNEQNMGKKLLSEMQVTKDMAKKFANPETYKTLEKGIFAQKPEQKLEQTHSRKR